MLCRDSSWHRRALYLIRALPVVIGRNTQSGFYWITPAQCWRGFTVIEQLYGRRGDSQMVLIRARDDSYCMPYCSLTLLEALKPRSSHIFYVCHTYVYNYPLIRFSFHVWKNTITQYRQQFQTCFKCTLVCFSLEKAFLEKGWSCAYLPSTQLSAQIEHDV